MNDLVLAVQQGFGLALRLLAPFALAAAAVSLGLTFLGSLLGLQDETVSLVGRMAAVLLVALFLGSMLADEMLSFTRALWAGLAAAAQASQP